MRNNKSPLFEISCFSQKVTETNILKQKIGEQKIAAEKHIFSQLVALSFSGWGLKTWNPIRFWLKTLRSKKLHLQYRSLPTQKEADVSCTLKTKPPNHDDFFIFFTTAWYHLFPNSSKHLHFRLQANPCPCLAKLDAVRPVMEFGPA